MLGSKYILFGMSVPTSAQTMWTNSYSSGSLLAVSGQTMASQTQAMLDCVPCPALTMPHKIGNVLDNKKPGFMHAQNRNDIANQIPPLWAFQSLLVTGLGEWLARETCTQDVMAWNGSDIECPDIAVGTEIEIAFIERRETIIDLARKDAFMS